MEDQYLDSYYEDRFEVMYDPFGYEADDAPVGYDEWEEDEEDYEPDVDDDFPMSLEYEGPFGLSGYDEY